MRAEIKALAKRTGGHNFGFGPLGDAAPSLNVAGGATLACTENVTSRRGRVDARG